MQREVDTNPALAGGITRPIGDYLRSLFYDSVALEPEYLAYAATIVGTDRLVLGSDAPFPLGEPDPVSFVRKALGEESAVRQVLGDNAARLLGD